MAITKVINDAVDLNQASDYSGLRLPVGTTGNVVESFTTDYLVVAGGGGGGEGYYGGGGGAGGLRTSYNNSTTTTNSLSFPSGKTAIATYMLDNNATDISGNYNGTETNISYNTGKYGGAAVFNGSSSYISGTVGATATTSFSMWVKINDSSTSQFIQVFDNNNFAIFIYSGKLNIQYASGSNSNGVAWTISNASNWNHIAGTFASSSSTLYVNKVQKTESMNNWVNAESVPYIGNRNALDGYFNGEIDQVRIYDSALSATDVSNIYNNEVQALSGGGSAAESSLTLTAGVAYNVTVGSGALGGNTQSGTADNGNNSIFSTITSNGGGGGQNRAGSFGSNGGSGGGGALNSSAGGNGTLNQGYAGGSLSAAKYGAGGGGASEIGLIPLTDYNTSPQRNSLGAPGGDGLSVSITGTATYYAGGGGGGARNPGPDAGTSGGLGGGGNGGKFAIGEDGSNNTGGGGGGGGDDGDNGGNGGSGVVILRYPTASVSSFTTTGTLNTPSTTDTLADNNYPVTNTAYYKLDGNATDSSVNGYNGTASNVTWQNGRFGQAAVFNGSSSYIDTGISTLSSDGGSVSLWVKTTDTTASFFGTNSNSDTNRFYFGVRDSKFWIGAGNAQSYTVSASNLIDGNWHNVVLTLDGSTAKYYLDGASTPVASTSYSGGGVCNVNPVIGGLRTSGGVHSSYYTNGSIDQVRIYSTALTDSQVTQLYEEHYQTKFTDGSDTAIVFTEGTGTVTFSGVDPASPQGALRTNTSYSEDGSASVIEHYNGTDWKYFDAIKYCTTNTLNFPSGAGCIASYNLDNNVDDIGNTYNGLNSSVTFNASGKFGAAAVFNGSSSKISFSSSPIPSSGAFTVSAWVKTSVSNHCFISFGDFWLKAEYLSGVFSLGDINTSFQGTTDISDGNWHHCVLTVDNSNNIALYVDGTSEDTGTSAISRTNGGSFVIGVARNSSPVYWWNGSIDQVRIFNDSLTSDEVSKLYNNEIACS